jgi:hypothetical protein
MKNSQREEASSIQAPNRAPEEVCLCGADVVSERLLSGVHGRLPMLDDQLQRTETLKFVAFRAVRGAEPRR